MDACGQQGSFTNFEIYQTCSSINHFQNLRKDLQIWPHSHPKEIRGLQMLPRGQSVSRDQSQQVRRDLASRLIDLQYFFDGDDNIFDYGCVIL